MKHRKILSAVLALVMALALTVPAFAAEAEPSWSLRVSEDDDWIEKEFQFQNLTWQDEEEGTKRIETEGSATVNLLVLRKGETAKLTHGGLSFYGPRVMAWSDPDGDGVYTTRWFEPVEQGHSEGSAPSYTLKILPVGMMKNGETSLTNNYAYFRQDGQGTEDEMVFGGDEMCYAQWPSILPEAGAEALLHADTLLNIYGPNTLLQVAAYDAETLEVGWWYLLLDGAEPTQPAEAGTYTVKYGDTWGQIALNNYGSYGAWRLLWKANGYKGLSTGKDIVLPEKLGSYTRLPAQVLSEGEKLYTVKAGDTLGQIAVAAYKDINMYKAIFERNSDRLKNANSIYEGQVIVLPVKSEK